MSIIVATEGNSTSTYWLGPAPVQPAQAPAQAAYPIYPQVPVPMFGYQWGCGGPWSEDWSFTRSASTT
eukprot:8282565-Lingulodinium_polyedra.AAC.1